MFRHIISFKFKSSLPESEITAIFEAIGELQQKIPGIITYSWGKNQYSGPCASYDYCFIMDFDSQDSRDRYQTHPDHIKVVNERVIPNMIKAEVMDYFIPDWSQRQVPLSDGSGVLERLSPSFSK